MSIDIPFSIIWHHCLLSFAMIIHISRCPDYMLIILSFTLTQGADLTKSTVHTLSLKDTMAKTKTCSNSLTSLMTVLPNQGVLHPYEKIPIYFRFSPRYSNSKQGWKGTSTPPPRQDFALFMNITTVGSSSRAKGDTKRKDDITGMKFFPFTWICFYFSNPLFSQYSIIYSGMLSRTGWKQMFQIWNTQRPAMVKCALRRQYSKCNFTQVVWTRKTFIVQVQYPPYRY